MNLNFKKQNSLQDRTEESTRIMQKYPERIPIICERSLLASSECPNIDKNKYLVNRELTIGQFVYVNPSKDLIIVRLGKKEGKADWWTIFTSLAKAY
jgi:hypothetical protein